jgi:hypothetical protein
MSSSQAATIKLNIAQNRLTFELELIEEQSIIFKKELFKKILDSAKSNLEKLENYRTITIKCLYPNC